MTSFQERRTGRLFSPEPEGLCWLNRQPGRHRSRQV